MSIDPSAPLPSRRWYRRYLMLLAFLLHSLILPACQADEPFWPRPLPNVVKIGLVAPFEGRYRHIGYDAIYAARLAVREMNASGSTGDLRLELVAYDDRGDAEAAERIAHNLVVDPDVLAVLGNYRSESSAAAAPVYAKAGLPYLVLGGWAPPGNRALHLMPHPEAVASAMVTTGLQEGTRSVTLWAGESTESELDGALMRAIRSSPLSLVASDADLILAAASPVDTAERLAALTASGWLGRLVGAPDLASSAFGTVAGPAAVAADFITPYPFPQDLDGTESWIAAYRAVGPHVPDPGPYAFPTYEAIGLVSDALRAARESKSRLDRQTLREELRISDRVGPVGEIRFDDEGYWSSASLYRYRWGPEAPVLVEVLP